MVKYIFSFAIIISFFSFKTGQDENPFWNNGEPVFEVQQLFEGERFPNVVVATNGNVVTSWGRKDFRVSFSEDGGKTWCKPKTLHDPGFHGGGMVVNDNNGDILVFMGEKHPEMIPKQTMKEPVKAYKSEDNGKTWNEYQFKILPDLLGNVPDLHMSERGITLKHGEKAGRLIRPARVYYGNIGAHQAGYNTAIYSDDNGKTWHPSSPFPALGTGEGAIEELSNGVLYYNSRRHWAPKGENPRRRWEAWSYDQGETWADLKIIEKLPDGAQHRDYGLMGGLVRLPIEEHDILIFSNIESEKGRHHGTVWASFDGGKTWPVKRLVDEGDFAYSSLAAGKEGTPAEGMIYLLYEAGPVGKIARFNLAWVTNGRDWREFLDK